jgi:hypothetical protein
MTQDRRSTTDTSADLIAAAKAISAEARALCDLLATYDRDEARARLDALPQPGWRPLVLDVIAQVGTRWRNHGEFLLEMAHTFAYPPAAPRDLARPDLQTEAMPPHAAIDLDELAFCYQDPRRSKGLLTGGFIQRAIPCDGGLANVGIHEGDHVSVYCTFTRGDFPDATVVLAEIPDAVVGDPAPSQRVSDFRDYTRYLGILGHDAQGQPFLHYDGPAPWDQRRLALPPIRVVGEVVEVTHKATYGHDCGAWAAGRDESLWRWCRFGEDAGEIVALEPYSDGEDGRRERRRQRS